MPEPDDEEPNDAEPRPLGRSAVPRPTHHWYVLAATHELREKPQRRTLFGLPIVLFRDEAGRAAALLDRCPHRNVPLSLGTVVDGTLACAYHGWRFGPDGVCRFIPSRVANDEAEARRAPSFAVRELDGFVWVFGAPGTLPKREPYRFRFLDTAGYDVVRRTVDAPASLHATLENALDVPHTAFLHRGLFRGESRGIRITARVRRRADRVEAEYVGEPRPSGLVGRLLSPSGGLVTHVDRFLVPSIAEVEYAIGDENHILVAVAMTPLEDELTRLHTVVAYRTRIPRALLEPVVVPLALRIFHQDAVILAAQTANLRRFGGPRFASTELDVLGRHILRLLRAAERGELASDDALLEERSVELLV